MTFGKMFAIPPCPPALGRVDLLPLSPVVRPTPPLPPVTRQAPLPSPNAGTAEFELTLPLALAGAAPGVPVPLAPAAGPLASVRLLPPSSGGPRRPSFFRQNRLGLTSLAIGVGWVTLDSLGVVPQLIGAELSAKLIVFGLVFISAPIYLAGLLVRNWRARPDRIASKPKAAGPATPPGSATTMWEGLRQGNMDEVLRGLTLGQTPADFDALSARLASLATSDRVTDDFIPALSNQNKARLAKHLAGIAVDPRVDINDRALALAAIRIRELYFYQGVLDGVAKLELAVDPVGKEARQIGTKYEDFQQAVRDFIAGTDGHVNIALAIRHLVRAPGAITTTITIEDGVSFLELRETISALRKHSPRLRDDTPLVNPERLAWERLAHELLNLASRPLAPDSQISEGDFYPDRLTAIETIAVLNLPLEQSDRDVINQLAASRKDSPMRTAARVIRERYEVKPPTPPTILARLTDSDRAVRKVAAVDLAQAMSDAVSDPTKPRPFDITDEIVEQHATAFGRAVELDPVDEQLADLLVIFLDAVAAFRERDIGGKA